MKGFPNQVADLGKLSKGVRCIQDLLERHLNPRDDGVLGEALVRAGVLGTGHSPLPTDQYLAQQKRKRRDRQSFRTSARGLRELYRLLGLIEDTSSGTLRLTSDGIVAATFVGSPASMSELDFWRRVIRNFAHDGGDGTTSHPYQVMLRLIARVPGITRAKCAIALEARDDTQEELDRIVALSTLTEEEIRESIAVSRSNWDNAKKVLPRFAEQLGDVVKIGQSYQLADAPGSGVDTGAARSAGRSSGTVEQRRPRGSRVVTATTIGMAGIGDHDEAIVPPTLDPEAARAATRLRADRLRRHNILVRRVAARLAAGGLDLFEDPFDVLGTTATASVLGEIKTLDGTVEDERNQVRSALGQLLYYEAFLTDPALRATRVEKFACFEHPISEAHRLWLNQSGIAVVWIENGGITGDALAAEVLGDYFPQLG